jgi:hypothetical protein
MTWTRGVTAMDSLRRSHLSITSGLRTRFLFVVVFLLAGAAGLGIAAPPASASCLAEWDSWGLNYHGVNGNDVRTRAFVQGGGAHANSCGYTWSTVGIQENPPSPSNVAMLQAGYHTQTSDNIDDCGGPGLPPAAVFEYTTHDHPAQYHCVIYGYLGSGGVTEGDLFSVVKQNSGWQPFDNGAAMYPLNLALGFSSGFSFVRGEAAWTTTTPDYYMTWGPTGTTHWQYYLTTSSGYSDVGSGATPVHSDSQDSDNDWYIGTPPSPFYIQWIGG